MNTLIKLYGERATENVIGPETFKPKHIIYMCPPEIAEDKSKLATLKRFFEHRGYFPDIEFAEISFYKTDKILQQLRKARENYPDLAVDVTGGTDAALIAAGMFSSETDSPIFTYSRKKNCFYDINHAGFADGTHCTLIYNVSDFFMMTGGVMAEGRVDNSKLKHYTGKLEPFFKIFLKYKKDWANQIAFIQKISKGEKKDNASLSVSGDFYQKTEKNGKVPCNTGFFNDLQKIGFIKNLDIVDGQKVSFKFLDHRVRMWLRDVGSVLELYMYKMCVSSGIFNDVINSAVVNWDYTMGERGISNEIDVVCARGVVPLFVSCKTCDIKTVALNELAILKDRFGGKGAKACVVTTEHCNALARHRASQLGIAVIDIEELENNTVCDRLKAIMKVKDVF